MTGVAFVAVLVRCPKGHYEATTREAWRGVGPQRTCARCTTPLTLVREATIYPVNSGPLDRPTRKTIRMAKPCDECGYPIKDHVPYYRHPA